MTSLYQTYQTGITCKRACIIARACATEVSRIEKAGAVLVHCVCVEHGESNPCVTECLCSRSFLRVCVAIIATVSPYNVLYIGNQFVITSSYHPLVSVEFGKHLDVKYSSK